MPAAANRAVKPAIVKILWIFDWRFSGLITLATVAIISDKTPMPPKKNGDSSINAPILHVV